MSELNEAPGKFEKYSLLFVPFFPIEPADLIVLAIGVIIAVLGPAEFIAAEQHRHTLRNKERGEKITALSFAQGADFRIVARAFHAVVP